MCFVFIQAFRHCIAVEIFFFYYRSGICSLAVYYVFLAFSFNGIYVYLIHTVFEPNNRHTHTQPLFIRFLMIVLRLPIRC